MLYLEWQFEIVADRRAAFVRSYATRKTGHKNCDRGLKTPWNTVDINSASANSLGAERLRAYPGGIRGRAVILKLGLGPGLIGEPNVHLVRVRSIAQQAAAIIDGIPVVDVDDERLGHVPRETGAKLHVVPVFDQRNLADIRRAIRTDAQACRNLFVEPALEIQVDCVSRRQSAGAACIDGPAVLRKHIDRLESPSQNDVCNRLRIVVEACLIRVLDACHSQYRGRRRQCVFDARQHAKTIRVT